MNFQTVIINNFFRDTVTADLQSGDKDREYGNSAITNEGSQVDWIS